MPPIAVCPSVADYQKMLNGQTPAPEVAVLAGHLETCERCAATIHGLLKDDSLADSVSASGAAPALGHLPPDLVSKLLSLSDAPVPMASAVENTQVTTDGGAARAAKISNPTVYLSPGMTAPQAPGELGRLGGYRVLEVLGEGGMGLVYRAEDINLQRLVALKVMKADLARNDTSRKRFLAEARAAAKVRSDHVVTIFQTGEDGETAYAAMELLRGAPLDNWLRSHRDGPLTEFIRIGREMALGLHAAHEEGLIHRDIKPANVWIESSGRVKILDFGLARSVEGDVHLTNSGAVVGTPAYMAPEQACGHKVDHRADLFSLGCVLHRMTTGQMPFKGETVMSILTALAIETPPPAHELNPKVPLRLSDLISRLLAKKPDGRPPTAMAVADELKVILDGEIAVKEPSTALYVPPVQPIVLPMPGESPSEFDFGVDTAVVSPRGSGGVSRAATRRAPEPEDDSDDVSEEDLPPVRPAARQAAAKSRKPLVFVAVAVLAAVGLAVAASQLIFNTKDGTLVVEVEPDADVRFKNGKLEVYDANGKLKYTLEPSDKNKSLPPGKYLVKVVGADGVKLETDTFEIASNGKTSVRVKASGPVAVAANPKKDSPAGRPVVPGAPGGAGLVLFFNGIGAEAPAPALDTQKPWTAEAYFTPLTENFAKTNCQVIGCDEGFGFHVHDGKYSCYSRHGSTSAGVVKAGERVHVACVQTETKRMVFLNGKLVGSTDNPLPVEKKAVGKFHFSLVNHVDNQPPIDVLVEGVRLSQVVRYTKDFTPPGRHSPDKDTLALYHCDEGSGDKLTDSSGNNLHAKIINARWGKPTSNLTLPPGVLGPPLVLRKGTWEQGPPENILPGQVPRPRLLDGIARWQITTTTTNSVAAWCAPAFSPDGKLVALSDGPYVRIYDSLTGALTGVGLRRPSHLLAGANTSLVWSADSKWVRLADHRGVGFDSGSVFAADGTSSAIPWIQHVNVDYGWNPKYPLFACEVHGKPDVICIFDPTQAKPVEIATKHGPKGKAVWSPDGEWLLVVREDKTAQLFGRDGKPGAQLAGTVEPTAIPAWTADSALIAAPISANEIGFWKKDGTAAGKTAAQDKATLSLHWRPDGKVLGVVAADGLRYFWTADGKSEGSADTKGEPGLVWAKDGKGFFTPGKYWPTIGPAFANTARPNAVEFLSPDTARIAYMSARDVVISELKNGDAKDVGKAPRGVLAAWSADGQRFAVTDDTGAVVYDARDAAKAVRLGAPAVANLGRIVPSPKGDRLAVAPDGSGFVLVCTPDGKIQHALPETWVRTVEWHPDGKHLVVASDTEANVTVYDADSGRAVVALKPEGTRYGQALFSPANPDDLLLRDGGVAVWRWKAEKAPQQRFEGVFNEIVPSSDGKQFVVRSGNTRPAVRVSADLKTLTPIAGDDLIGGPNHLGPPLLWLPDGKHLLVGSEPLTVRTPEGKIVETFKDALTGSPNDATLRLSPDNRTVLGIGPGGSYLCDLGTKTVTKLPAIKSRTPFATLSADNRYVISAEGSQLKYWSAATGELVRSVLLLADKQHVVLSPAGEVLGRSEKADEHFRYLIEDKTGRITIKTPAEMAKLLPKAPDWQWQPTADQQTYLDAIAALPAKDRPAAVLRKMNELNPLFGERPPIEFQLDPKDGEPTSCRVVSPVAYEGWPLAALTSLKKIDLTETHILDYRPLAALPLEEIQLKLILDNTVSEAALKSIPTLKTINGIAAKDFWAERTAVRADIEKMTGKVAALSPEDQTTWVRGIMKRLHPKVPEGAFGAVAVGKAENGLLQFRGYDLHAGVYDFSPVRVLEVESFFTLDGNIFDVTPLKFARKLKVIELNRGAFVRDLSPLAGLPLENLILRGHCSVKDLSPLKGMPLKSLSFGGAPETDLSPLRGMPLESLELGGAKDLKPLAGLPLKKLGSGHYSPIDDLSPLKGMPLEVLGLHRSQVTDISPLAGMKFKEFGVFESPVADFTPLKGSVITSLNIYRGTVDPVLATLPLKHLELLPRLFSPEEEKILRGLKLETINGKPPADVLKEIETKRKAAEDKIAATAKTVADARKAGDQKAYEKVVSDALSECGQYPKVKFENGEVVEAETGGGPINGFADFTNAAAFPKLRKLSVVMRGDYSPLVKLTELEELTCPPGEVALNRPVLKLIPKLKTINGKPAKEVLEGK